MSKSNKTTKVATFKEWLFSNGEEVWAADLRQDNTGDCIGAVTTCGLVSAVNTFTAVLPGQRVILRRNVGRRGSWGESQWVMTGLA